MIWSTLPDSYFVQGSNVIHCRILILYPAVMSFIAGFSFCTRQWHHSCRSTEVCFPGKVFCWLFMSHIESLLNIVAWYNELKLFRQVEHVVPGNNIEKFPDERLMTNQQRNILSFWCLKAINNSHNIRQNSYIYQGFFC